MRSAIGVWAINAPTPPSPLARTEMGPAPELQRHRSFRKTEILLLLLFSTATNLHSRPLDPLVTPRNGSFQDVRAASASLIAFLWKSAGTVGFVCWRRYGLEIPCASSIHFGRSPLAIMRKAWHIRMYGRESWVRWLHCPFRSRKWTP